MNSLADLSKPWTHYSFVAFDTETSGAYPLGADVVEFGAVRWQNGAEVDKFQTLLKPRELMSDFIIGIHGITNEMVKDAPTMSEKIHDIAQFFKGSILMAHHAPFDMGFLAIEFEKFNIPFPSEPVLCTSLLARKLIPESPNHKLQTLITQLKLERGSAHRALDDARACLYVGLECMRRMGELTPLEDIIKMVGKDLLWPQYSVHDSRVSFLSVVVDALEKRQDLDIIYQGGSLANETRRVTPIGIVRNPDGDYLMALCHRDRIQKRFYLNKFKDAVAVFKS